MSTQGRDTGLTAAKDIGVSLLLLGTAIALVVWASGGLGTQELRRRAR